MSITSYVLEQEELEKDFPKPVEQDLLHLDPAYQVFTKETETTVEEMENDQQCF
jgi:hypothetical protein